MARSAGSRHGVCGCAAVHEQATLTVESPAILRSNVDGQAAAAVILDEDGTVSVDRVVMALVGQRVLSSVGFKTGALRLVFESGALLTVPYDDHYEAWQLTGPSGRMWVSLPGGGLVTFPPPTT